MSKLKNENLISRNNLNFSRRVNRPSATYISLEELAVLALLGERELYYKSRIKKRQISLTGPFLSVLEHKLALL